MKYAIVFLIPCMACSAPTTGPDASSCAATADCASVADASITDAQDATRMPDASAFTPDGSASDADATVDVDTGTPDTGPTIRVMPLLLNFGPVPQGQQRTATLTVVNDGDAPLVLTDIRFQSIPAGSAFVWRVAGGQPPPLIVPPLSAGANYVDISVDYTPLAAGTHTTTLLIGSNDVSNSPRAIVVTGGAIPRIQVTPSDQLTFGPPSPAPAPARCADVQIANTGTGDLVIEGIDIFGPDATRTHPGVDDFSVDVPQGCGISCNPNILLCSVMDPACVRSETTLSVCYANNDSSSIDLAELQITSNDPTDPVHIVVLSAESLPCLFPTPVITVTPSNPQVGQRVTLSAAASDPGGAPGGSATLTDYRWTWLFTPGTAPTFESQGAITTAFTLATPGNHIAALHVTNDCGARSQAPATENIP